ncbi:MAG: DNA polymerase III subunit beta [Desulfovibrionaceae bacterium]|nr:DNA polymerase III subunit beta [Desulfovibrionaceae bacterium]
MKITLNTEHCVSGVQKAGNITPSKVGSSYLKTMWLRASKEKGTVSFMTTDASTEYIGTYPAEVIEDGLVGVQSRAMTDLIRNLPSGLVHIETDESANTVIVSQGKRLYKLPTSSSTWFQEFSQFPEGDAVTWNGESLSDIIEKILFCISDDEDSSFGCLCIKPNGQGGIDFCGLDGNKFAMVTIINDELLQHLPADGIKIQKKYISDIKKLLSSEDIKIMIGDKRFYVRDNQFRDMFSVPLTQVSFVDYSIFISRVSGDDCSHLTISKEEFLRALSRSLIFNTKDEVGVYLSIDDDSVTLNSRDKTTGSATETISAVCESSVSEVAFVTKSLIDILQHVPGDSVSVTLSSREGPCSFKAVDDENYNIIVMPMQIVNKTYYQEDDI